MVSFKQFLIVTSLLLSRIAAAPLPTSELSVVAAEVRAIDNFAIESRDLSDHSIVDIQARKTKSKKPKATKPKTGKPKTPKPKTPKTKKPKNPTKPTKPKKPANGAACPMKKPKDPKNPKNPRSLERREGPLKPAKSDQDIGEDMYVLSAKGKVVVTNMSGCTAIFFWDASDIPSVFHIFCGDETDKTWEAIDKVGSKAKAFSIIASDKKRYENAQKEIVGYAENEGWGKLEETKQELYKTDKSGKTVLKFTATAGSRTITEAKYPNPNLDC
jgi:type IV secretory pathway VirB10-like protein